MAHLTNEALLARYYELQTKESVTFAECKIIDAIDAELKKRGL